MKRRVKLYGAFLCLALFLLMAQTVCAADSSEFAGGDGTPQNPYQITTKQELDNVRNYPDACFILMNDIVFDDADFEEGGEFYNYKGTEICKHPELGEYTYEKFGWIPIEGFNGIFDGNNHVIKNLKMSCRSEESSFNGLFKTNGGTIKNLAMLSIDYYGGIYDMQMGGIAGWNKGTIVDCFVDGKMYFKGTAADGAGIASTNDGTISRCVNSAEIHEEFGGSDLGGIVSVNNGVIEDCLNTGFVHNNSRDRDEASGICNNNRAVGIVKNCVNYGPVMSTNCLMDEYPNGTLEAGITSSNDGKVQGCINVINCASKGVYAKNEYDNILTEKPDGCINILIKKLNEEDFMHLDFNNTWTWHSEYPAPVLNNSFSEKYLKNTTGFLDNTYNLIAYGITYKSIAVSWNEIEGASGYVIYREDVKTLGEAPDGWSVVKPMRQVKVIEAGDITSFTDNYEIKANSSYSFNYKILPYFDVNGVRIYGALGGWASAMVVDTNSTDASPDNIQPVIDDIKIETTEVYRPGSLKITINAYDNESDIKEIYVFGEKIAVSGGKQINETFHIPVSSEKEFGEYSLGMVCVTDAAGNTVTVDGEFFDNNKITVKEEFDIEFTGSLSNSNVAVQLKEMEAGKTVVLKIDENSQGILKKEVLDAIKGQDKTVVVYVDEEGSAQWVFHGTSITEETKDLQLDMQISQVDGAEYGVPGKIINLQYAENGILPGEVNFRLKSDYIAAVHQDTGILYLYYDAGENLELESSECPVIKDGSSYWCYMDLTHNSSFYLSGEILKKPIGKQQISLSSSTYSYTGTAKKPTVTIDGLTKGTDYTVKYENNINAGTGKVVITGLGDYSGTVTKTFTIKPAKITSATLSVVSYTYNGIARKPAVTVKAGTLSPATKISGDTSKIDLTYASGRKNAGTYKVTVKGKGNYTGTITKTFTIKPAKITSATLSATSYTYNGNVKKPAVTVKAGKLSPATKISGDTSNIDLTYASGRKNVGTYKVTVKGKGNYSGTLVKTFKINPVKTAITGLTAGNNKFTVKWKKKTSQVTGYQVCYSTSSKFSNPVIKTVKSNKTTSKTYKKLKDKKTYYVKVRTYKTVKGVNYYSGWSEKKSVRTK